MIVTNLRMPRMDGVTLLDRVKVHYPIVVRIVLSGQSDMDRMLRVVPPARPFLSQPCNAYALMDVLKSACDLQDLINNERLKGLLGQIGALPAQPKTCSEITKLLANGNASLDDVAAIIKRGIGISTKIL